MPTYRYLIQNVEFSPINTGDYTHDYTLEQEEGFYQFVYSLSGEVSFGADVYDFVNKHSDCQKISFVIKERSNIGEFVLFNGYFTNRDCSFSELEKTIDIKPIEDTLYTCVKDNLNVKFNFLQSAGLVSAKYKPTPEIEWQTRPIYDVAALPDIGFGWGTPVVLSDGISRPFLVDVYARETKTVYCLGGEPQPPTGTGWELLEDNCAVNGTSRWGRKPPILTGLVGGDFTTTSCVPPCTPAYPPATTQKWIYIDTWEFPALDSALWIDYNSYALEEIDFNNGRDLVNVLNYGLNFIGCAEADIQSTFLNDDINPITLEASKTNNIQLHAISDLKEPTADIKATLERTSLSELFEGYLYGKLNCRIIVDNNTKRVRVEHVSQILGGDTYDITNQQILKRKYKFDNSDIPTAEEFPSLDSSIEYTGVDIRFLNDCAKDTKAYQTDKYYSEIESITNDPESYPNDGIVTITPLSLAATDDPDGYGVLSEFGAITGVYTPNLPQAMSSLHHRFWGYDRPFPNGVLNFRNSAFEYNRPVKELEEIDVPLCNLGGSFFRFNPYAFFIGVDFNKGFLSSASYNESTKEVKLNIKYYE